MLVVLVKSLGNCHSLCAQEMDLQKAQQVVELSHLVAKKSEKIFEEICN